MYEIVDKSTRFRQVRQLLLSLIVGLTAYIHVILKKTLNWSARSKEAIILRWAPSWIFTVTNWAKRYCIRKYPDLAPTSPNCHTSPPLNPSGLSPPRPPRVRWRRVTFEIERPHDSGSITYLKISSLESGFRKLRIRLLPDSPDTCGRKRDLQKKKLRIQKNPDTCGRGLNL